MEKPRVRVEVRVRVELEAEVRVEPSQENQLSSGGESDPETELTRVRLY